MSDGALIRNSAAQLTARSGAKDMLAGRRERATARGISSIVCQQEIRTEPDRKWLYAFPEKILFGTDAFTNTWLRGWEEMTWIATRSGRIALALALTRMMTAGEITRVRAEEVARMVLRENAIKLYQLAP